MALQGGHKKAGVCAPAGYRYRAPAIAVAPGHLGWPVAYGRSGLTGPAAAFADSSDAAVAPHAVASAASELGAAVPAAGCSVDATRHSAGPAVYDSAADAIADFAGCCSVPSIAESCCCRIAADCYSRSTCPAAAGSAARWTTSG